MVVFAEVCDGTFSTAGRACRAPFPPEKDEAVAEVGLLFGRDQLCENAFYLGGVGERFVVHTEASAETDTMGVGDDAGNAVYIAAKEVGYLSSDARKGKEVVHIFGHLAAEPITDYLTGRLDTRRLGAVETARADRLLKLGEVCVGNSFKGRIFNEKVAADDIYPCVGALRRKPTHNEKLPGLAPELQRAFGCRIYFFKPRHDLGYSMLFLLIG